MEKKEKGTFTSSLGFILAAAGSAVGLGNIWRFPYLAAKDGGGLFLVVYLVFALTFGFTLLISEISIGRKTKESPLTAYKKLNGKWGFLGIFSFVVPFIIYPYYCVIGGWVVKYLASYFAFEGHIAAGNTFFGAFTGNIWQPIFYLFLFSIFCFIIVYKGVENGIEKYSKILMPALVILIVFIAVYGLFLSYTDPATGETRTALQGAAIYFIPSFKGVTFSKFLHICLDAISQLFYSLSIAMGIMIAYGSYMKDDVNLGGSVNKIEIFDTGIAILAGLVIVPATYVFQGLDGMKGGASLMFIAIPKVFESLGGFGVVLGLVFFVMVLFAALTSAVSILEAIVSSCMDKYGWNRKKATLIMAGAGFVLGVIVCLGYNVLSFNATFANVENGQILDIFDWVSNSFLMPVVALLTCILIGWVLKPKTIIDEITKNGESFGRKGLYVVMVRYVAPVLLLVLLLAGFNLFN